MKTLFLAAAFATVMALPAFAEVTNVTTDASAAAARAQAEHPHGEFREHGHHEGFKGEHEAMHKEREAFRDECHKRIEEAKGPGAKEAVVKDCRAKADKMRAERRAEEDKKIAEHRAEMDKKMAEMKAKHEAMKAAAPAPAAK